MTTQAINLNLLYNREYMPVESDDIVFDEGDLSQLGLKRNAFQPHQRYPVFASYEFKCARNILPVPVRRCLATDTPADAKLTFNVRNVNVKNRAHNAQHIAALQQVLRIDPEATLTALLGSRQFTQAIDARKEEIELSTAFWDARLLQYMDAQGRTNVQLSKLVQYTPANNEEPSKLDHPERLSYPVLRAVATMVTDNSLQELLYARAWYVAADDNPARSIVYNDPIFKAQFTRLEGIFGATTRVISDEMGATFAYQADRTRTTITYHRPAVDQQPAADVDVAIVNTAAARRAIDEFVTYVIHWHHINEVSGLMREAFAGVRSLLKRHNLLTEASEIQSFQDFVLEAYDKNCSVGFMRYYASATPWYMCLNVALHSFLKSGHHATAANIVNTVSRMMAAVNLTYSEPDVREIINAGVYHGTHPGDLRRIWVYALHRNKTQKDSNAIVSRLYTNPPLAMPYLNMAIFIEALADARFFEITGRQAELETFRAHIKRIDSTKWLSAPYAHFMFGSSADEPMDSKQYCIRFAGWAAAVTRVLPNSSLNDSASLARLNRQGQSQSIMGTIEVEAFAGAVRSFVRLKTRLAMEQATGGRPLRLED